VVGDGQIGGGSAQEVMRGKRVCMQRRGSLQWCRRHRGELRQGSARSMSTACPGASKRGVRSRRRWGVCKPREGAGKLLD
jgi:hypothetical protein